MCRRSHRSKELNGPMSKKGYRWWKGDNERDTAGGENRSVEADGADCRERS